MPTPGAAARLKQLEQEIDVALTKPELGYMEIGTRLIEIHDGHLWGEHSFVVYAKLRFDFCGSSAYDYLNSARLGRALIAEGKPPPVSIRAALAILQKQKEKKKKAEKPDDTDDDDEQEESDELELERAVALTDDEERDARPVSEFGNETPTSQASLLHAFGKEVNVTVKDSDTPGRWNVSLDDMLAEGVLRVARAANGVIVPEKFVAYGALDTMVAKLKQDLDQNHQVLAVDRFYTVDFTWYDAPVRDLEEFAEWRRQIEAAHNKTLGEL